MTSCPIHLPQQCAVHDHRSPCPDCAIPAGVPCTTTASRTWCCPACWHDQNPNTEGA